jgi:hypothetical protein
VMGIDMQITFGFDVEIDQAMAIWSSLWSRNGTPVFSFC